MRQTGFRSVVHSAFGLSDGRAVGAADFALSDLFRRCNFIVYPPKISLSYSEKMAIVFPAVARLKLLSVRNTISGYPENDRANPGLNLAQLEALLRTSKVLGCRWTEARSELHVFLQSCVRIVISFDQNSFGEILSYRLDQSFNACAKKKTAVACALSDYITVLAFSSTELATCGTVISEEEQCGPQVYCQRKVLGTAEDYEAHLQLNSGSDLLLYCLTPRSAVRAKRWRPMALDKPEWMVFVYACSTFRSKPLQRLHKLKGCDRQKVLHMAFPVDGLNLFTLFIHQEYPEALIIQRNVVEKHALRLISSNVFALPGAIVSLTVQPTTGWATLGLDDFSLVQISTWNNDIVCTGKSNMMPEMVQWSTNGMLLCVANSEGCVELYDAALQNVSGVLMNDLCDMGRGIRLRTCFNSISPLGFCQWINFDSSRTLASRISPSAILLVFEKGPLTLLQFAASEQGRRGQLHPLIRYHVATLKFQESVSCLEASRNHCSVEELIQASQLIFTSTAQRMFKLDESTTRNLDVIERLLDILRKSDPKQPRRAADTSAIQSCYSLLMRRYFSCLIRHGAFDRALAMAELTKDYGFHQTLLKNTSRVQEEQLKARIQYVATTFMGDKSNSSTLTSATVITRLPAELPKPITVRRDDDSLSWKDMGEI